MEEAAAAWEIFRTYARNSLSVIGCDAGENASHDAVRVEFKRCAESRPCGVLEVAVADAKLSSASGARTLEQHVRETPSKPGLSRDIVVSAVDGLSQHVRIVTAKTDDFLL